MKACLYVPDEINVINIFLMAHPILKIYSGIFVFSRKLIGFLLHFSSVCLENMTDLLHVLWRIVLLNMKTTSRSCLITYNYLYWLFK